MKPSRFIWDMSRFGLSPYKLTRRITGNKHMPRVIIISMPKAGTHLIERIICLHPNMYRMLIPTLHPDNLEKYGGLGNILGKLKTGEVLVTHLHYSKPTHDMLLETNIRPIFVIRDPRDIVVSRAFYTSRTPKHYYYSYAKDLSLEEQIRRAVLGDLEHGYPSIRQILEHFEGWLDAGLFTVRFEDMVNSDRRPHLIRDIFSYLGINLSSREISSISSKVISDASPTFRKGTTGEWPKYLQGELHELFLEHCREIMVRYGYN